MDLEKSEIANKVNSSEKACKDLIKTSEQKPTMELAIDSAELNQINSEKSPLFMLPSIEHDFTISGEEFRNNSGLIEPLEKTGIENQANILQNLNDVKIPVENTCITLSVKGENDLPKGDDVRTNDSGDQLDSQEFAVADRDVANGMSEAPRVTGTTDSSSEEDESSLEEDLNEGPPRAPDGGYGWVVVAAAFFTNLIADGITFTFGIIFVELLKHFKEAKGKTAWVGGTFMAMPLLSGPVASYLTDRFGCRKICICGSILASLGFIISSQAESIEVLILSFGILSGFGLAMCFVSAVVIVAYYFEKKRSFATGLSVCGSGLGTFLFAPISSSLIKSYGWRGTILILAAVFLNIAVCGALMRDLEWTKDKMRARRKRSSWLLKSQSQSLRTASLSTDSLNDTPRTLSIEELKRVLQSSKTLIAMPEEAVIKEKAKRLCSSVVQLPTYLHSDENLPREVLERLSSNKQVYNVMSKNYNSIFRHSQTKNSAVNQNISPVIKPHFIINDSILSDDVAPTKNCLLNSADLNSIEDPEVAGSKSKCVTLPRNLLRHSHTPRCALTYRGAMLNINRYRTKAKSCPNISITSIPRRTTRWYDCLLDLREVLAGMVDITHFMDIRFLLFALSNFILYSWYDVPYVFIADKAVEMNFSEQDSSFLISILGIVNTFGEILLGWVGDLRGVNPVMVYAMCMGACGLVTITIPLLTSYTALGVASGGFGLFISANYSLSSVILVRLITLDRFSNAYGLLLFVQGTANLVGPPFAGWLYDVSGNYDLSFFLAGVFIIFSGILLIILPTMKWCKKRTVLDEISPS